MEDMDRVISASPIVMVMVGLPGSGKSFFATQFSNSLNCPLVSEDKIRWMLFSNHTYNDNENAIVKQVADMMITELFRTKKTFILDGGYNSRTCRATLSTQAKKAGYRVVTVIVQTDEPTAKQRSLKRNSKRTGDRYKQSLSGAEFATQVKQYQAPLRIDKTAVAISGKHTYSTQARTILKKILEIQNTAPATEPLAMPIVRPRGPFIQ
jgi:predicted kinase